MNNNFTKTEKSLKHWLKNKITVTSATVVSFLIMGVVSFGQTNIDKDSIFKDPIKVTNENGEAKGVYVNQKAKVTNQAGNNIEVNGGTESHGIQGNHGVDFDVENNGTISVISSKGQAFGIQANGKSIVTNNGTISATSNGTDGNTNGDDTARGIVLNKGGELTNKNTIIASAKNAIGVDSTNATFKNEKGAKIEVKGGTDLGYGVRLDGGSGVNNGTISASSEGTTQGVQVKVSSETASDTTVFTNNGTISASSEKSAFGIYVDNGQNKKVSVINGKDGKIDVKSPNKSGVAVKLSQGTGKPEEIGLGNTKLENAGSISIDNGTAIDLGNNIGVNTATGTITVTGKDGTGVYTSGKFDNEGTINIQSNYGTGIKAFSGAITNSGKINVTGDENTYGVELFGQNATLLNTNEINVTNNNNKVGTSGLAYGVYLTNGATTTNTGTINVTSQDRAAGVGIYLDENYKATTDKELFINEKEGTIFANSKGGATANAISITNKSTDKVAVVNEGTLKATGKNGTITTDKGEKPFYNPVVDLSGKNVEFTNKGTIVAGNGVGIQLNGTDKLNATNNGTIEVNSTGKAFISYGTATNNGIIKITDKTAEQLKNGKFDTNSLFAGNVTSDGMIADKDGFALNATHENTIGGIKLTTGELNEYTGNVFFGEHEGSTIIGDETPTSKIDTLNIIGKVAIENEKNSDGTNKPAKLEINTLNFDTNGQFNIGADNILVLGDQDKNIVINPTISKSDRNVITLGNGAELGLENATVNKGANISGTGLVSATGKNTINSNITSNEFEVYDGETLFNGVLSSDTVTVDKGALNKDTKLTFSSEASFGKATTINSNDGTTVFEIGAKGENALKNAQGKVDVNGNIDFDTDKLTQNTTVDLGKQNDLNGAIYTEKIDGIYNTKLDKVNNELEFTYNKQLFANEKLNAVNNGFQILGDKVTSDIAQRESLADEVYSSNIYSTTVRVAYDNLRLNEEILLSMNHRADAGELKTFGKGLFSKDKFERRGINNDYSVDVETTGLLAGLEYGLSDSTTVGTVFSGSKQDVDVDHGSSDGDVLYLGVFGNKVVNNYDFTAGLGYQFGKYESDNSLISNTGDKYDSNAISGYVQGRYTADLGNGLSLQPRIKFGYTHLEQDDVRDANFALTNSDINTFNTEAGVDFVKTVQLDSSKLDVKLGTAYIKTMGDTDKTFTGQFFGDTAGSQFEVLGGELTENTIKFSLDAEMTFENGFFYNAGVNYRFGGEDTKVYGASVGVGYTF